jgi:hypothetical protein
MIFALGTPVLLVNSSMCMPFSRDLRKAIVSPNVLNNFSSIHYCPFAAIRKRKKDAKNVKCNTRSA